LYEEDEIEDNADIIDHLPNIDLDLFILVAHAVLKPHNMIAIARDEEVVVMNEHLHLRTIGTLLVDHVWVIRVGEEQYIASHSNLH
jgi:hypothetical protein